MGLVRDYLYRAVGSVAVATSGDDREKRDAAAAEGGDGNASLMLAENMEAEQSEQKLRAKRDLDADEIRELFASQRVPLDDYYTPGILSPSQISENLGFLQRVRIARNTERCNSHRDSVCPSVRPSVTFRYCVQTNEDTIVRFSASGRTLPLVSGEVKFIRIWRYLQGITPSEGIKVKRFPSH